MSDIFARIKKSPIFICGHPKSGTSLLRNLLDNHPELIVYPEESVFFRRFLPLAKGQPLEDQLMLADRYLTHIFEWNLEAPPTHQAGFLDRDYSMFSADDVRKYMRQWLAGGVSHLGEFLAAAVLAYGMVARQVSEKTRYWVEKTPYNEYFARKIFGWWPNAHCIHIVRDPRDNYLSYRRKHPEWSLSQFAYSWRTSVKTGWYNQRYFGIERYLVIRYEDLVHSPEDVMQVITKFLEISWADTLLQPSRAGVPWAGNSMFAQNFDEVSSAASGRWKQNLLPQEACRLERLVAPWLAVSGYMPITCKQNRFSVKESLWIGIEKTNFLKKEFVKWLKKQN